MRTCFKEKFGAPRQALMVSHATGVLKLKPEPAFREALNHLSSFSHVWIIFLFHQHADKGWRPTIEPPRLEAPRRVGVFASRSPHRPNPIGMSAVKLERIDLDAPGGIEIHLSGVDILDETPVLDVKPYLPFADRIPEASAGWAEGEINRYAVEYSEQALAALSERDPSGQTKLKDLITEMLAWDPRPRSQRSGLRIGDPAVEGKRFGFRIFDFDVQWEVRNGGIRVLDIVAA